MLNHFELYTVFLIRRREFLYSGWNAYTDHQWWRTYI